MRLTLRTLLAHLDRTLDPEDDAAIAAKLRESEFASRLVQRVRACLTSGSLAAPSAEATGTADDPNRIGEYLDSVLSAEQVAEVERICLESDIHLAEVAACHQVLTLVLAKPAEVSLSLRHRVYELGSDAGAGQHGGTNGSFSGQVPPYTPETSAAETLTRPLPTPGSKPGGPLVAPPILPVGPDDSGVSDAPTRIKATGKPAVGDEAIAGVKRLSPADLADYRVRPARVMPWLVSLGLLAAFLFVAAKAFSPLLDRQTRDSDRWLSEADRSSAVNGRESATEPREAPGSEDSTDPESSPIVDQADAPDGSPSPVVPPSPSTDDSSVGNTITDDAVEEGGGADSDATASDAAMPPSDPVDESDVAATPPAESLPDNELTESPAVTEPAESALAVDATDPPLPTDPPAEVEPIRVTGEGSLLLIRDPELNAWVLGRQDDVVEPASELICPPLYRDRLSLHGQVDLTLVGPAKLGLMPAPGQAAELDLVFGRYLVSGVEESNRLTIRFADTVSVLTLPSPDSIAALEVVSQRPAGANPENPQLTRSVLRVLAVQGAPSWRSGNRPEVVLESGQLLTLGGDNQVSLGDLENVPGWLEEPIVAVDSLESLAREGLLQLVRGDESIELSLREAMEFRRAEVSGLAARTMLLLDRFDVYFGTEGVFSQPAQKSYWPEHFAAMVKAIDRGPESAAAVSRAIRQMDGAQAELIYRMLWLYSDQDLAAGADEVLVKALDDSNMTVRVLASENLRRITGTVMNFRPEVESAARRSSDIKKWEVRLRRGDIRWSTSATGPAPQPDP